MKTIRLFIITLVCCTGCLLGQDLGRVVIVVNDELYPKIEESLNIYRGDLEKEGYVVVMKEWNLMDQPKPQELRGYLQGLYREGGGLKGAVFVGDLPIAWASNVGNDAVNIVPKYTMDHYFCDLEGVEFQHRNDNVVDGTTFDGPEHLEIWVGRLLPPKMDSLGTVIDQAEEIERYLKRNHLFRIGATRYPERQVNYRIPDIVEQHRQNLKYCFTPKFKALDPERTLVVQNDFDQNSLGWNSIKSLLFKTSYNYNFWAIHGLPSEFEELGYEKVSSRQVIEAGMLSYMIFAKSCLIGFFGEPNYMAGHLVFSPTSESLVALAHGIAIKDYPQTEFQESLKKGNAIGESFINSFNQAVIKGSLYKDSWKKDYTSRVIIGDPTLKLQSYMEARKADARLIGKAKLTQNDFKDMGIDLANIKPVVGVEKLGLNGTYFPKFILEDTTYRVLTGFDTNVKREMIYEGKSEEMVVKAVEDYLNKNPGNTYRMQYKFEDGSLSYVSDHLIAPRIKLIPSIENGKLMILMQLPEDLKNASGDDGEIGVKIIKYSKTVNGDYSESEKTFFRLTTKNRYQQEEGKRRIKFMTGEKTIKYEEDLGDAREYWYSAEISIAVYYSDLPSSSLQKFIQMTRKSMCFQTESVRVDIGELEALKYVEDEILQ